MTEKTIYTDSLDQTAVIFGGYDANIRLIEDAFEVNISAHDSENAGGNAISVSGADPGNTGKAAEALNYMKRIAALNGKLTENDTDYVIGMVRDGKSGELDGIDGDCICITNRGKPIKAKTVGQKRYVGLIRDNTVVMGVGPAGTGKTFLAVAMAVKALRAKTVSRIILTRPAVEAGEKLGYLPGDLQNKIDPYLRPLYDALFEMLGTETYQKNIERGIIEIAPLAYMRGRTLDDSFIILDEAQNTTPEQMKMFLTRFGFGSKMVITGDITQIDLPGGKSSGLKDAARILRDVPGIGVIKFSEQDVVRHEIVGSIIKAYEKFENARKERREEKNDDNKFRK